MPYDLERQREYMKSPRGRASQARWKEANTEKIRAKLARRVQRNVEILASLKARLCADCGGSFHPAAMQFDHLPEHGRRVRCVSGMTSGSTGRMLKEIAKTEVVCANCHCVRTHKRRQAA